MYAEEGLLFPYFDNFSLEVQNLEDFCISQKPNVSLGGIVQTSISDYDLGGEGDLFKAPEPIIEQPLVSLDPMTAALSLITSGDDAISPEALKVAADIESIQSEVFYECKKDMLGKEARETPLSEVLSINVPVARPDEGPVVEDKSIPLGQIPKSISSGCLSSMAWINGPQIGPNFISFSEVDFVAVYGMRRAFSDGDIKTLGNGNSNGNVSVVHSPLGQSQILGSCSSEDRRQKLSRYRSKKTKRNFGRKIKYACRKALADSQPRIRGRFAKTEESERKQ